MTQNINIPVPRAVTIYLDYRNWNKLFPITIRATRLIKEEDNQQTVEVDHKQEWKVINIITMLSEGCIRLDKFKKQFNGTFFNEFESFPSGACYRITAYISLKGFYKLLHPFVKWLVKKKIDRYVLIPFKEYTNNLK